MELAVDLTSHEQRIFSGLMEGLISSVHLPALLGQLQESLPKLVAADCVALCVSRPGRPSDYDWMVSGGPARLLAEYAALAPVDFVRPAVFSSPGTVFRDVEMLPPGTMKKTALYRRSQQLSLRLQHVQAVLLTLQPEWHAGLTLYRDHPLPFSDRDRAIHQWLTPLLAKAVLNCRTFESTSIGSRLLDVLFQRRDAAYVVVVSPGLEKFRTQRAQFLMERWFMPSDRDGSGLPKKLVERLKLLDRAETAPPSAPDTLTFLRPDGLLTATFARMPTEDGSHLWAIVLEESPHAVPLPGDLGARLTQRQREVVMLMLENLSNERIAEELGISLYTVKAHIKTSFKKLSMDKRTDLFYEAARRLKPV
ncbi:LuxR C-terminal-related transcriptional regulator [Myxococcus sp. CA040A]|uniref:helix-turn-helix transcriptional regulator n=1 Tax=Myxococcus sp. CA040A TaxID=2741738 RepID=UPI00157B6FC7|nr:LuxR C-terminal-related transcriptional regulator [Myxococcus sp. CA040A]NTX01830.1 response regulator transcription factor [Myxococcus sp. CA040A]